MPEGSDELTNAIYFSSGNLKTAIVYHLEVKTAECCNFNALFPACFLILPHHLSLAQASCSPDLIFFFFSSSIFFFL